MGVDPESEAQKYATGDHANNLSVPGAVPATFKGTSPLTFSGSYAVPPSNAPFLEASGHVAVEYKRAISGVTASGQKIVAIAGTVTGKFTIGQVVTLKEGANTENCVVAIVGTTNLTMVSNLTNSYTAAGFLFAGIGYQPLKAADQKSMTVAAYMVEVGSASPTSNVLSASGLVGTVEIVGDGIGKPVMASFDMLGKYDNYQGVLTAAIPAYSALCGEVPDNVLGCSMTIGGTAIEFTKFSLNVGNAITRIEKGSDASGYLSGLIEKREPVFTCDPIAGSASTDGAFADAIAGTPAEIVLTLEHYQIRIPRAQSVKPKNATRNGLHSWEKTFECKRNCITNGSTAFDTVLPVEATYEIIMGKRC
jgi:hypothetical protein